MNGSKNKTRADRDCFFFFLNLKPKLQVCFKVSLNSYIILQPLDLSISVGLIQLQVLVSQT